VNGVLSANRAQVGVLAVKALPSLSLTFGDLTCASAACPHGATIPSSAASSINYGGVSYKGHAFTKRVGVVSNRAGA